jgi:hypothetical protein
LCFAATSSAIFVTYSALSRSTMAVAGSIQTLQLHRLSDSGCAHRAQKFMLTAAYMDWYGALTEAWTFRWVCGKVANIFLSVWENFVCSKGKRPLGRLSCGLEYNFKIVSECADCEDMNWIQRAQNGWRWPDFMTGWCNFGNTTVGELLTSWQLLASQIEFSLMELGITSGHNKAICQAFNSLVVCCNNTYGSGRIFRGGRNTEWIFSKWMSCSEQHTWMIKQEEKDHSISPLLTNLM